jgi:hypothetical protein
VTLAMDIDGLVFLDRSINDTLVRDLADGGFIT